MAAQRRTILLIEDDDAMAAEIRTDLELRGYELRHARDSVEALEAVGSSPFDALIVDRMLPSVDGLSIVAELRERNHRMPMLILSALSSVDDRVKGLRSGGDDYLTKPFSSVELVARIEALLRRPNETRETFLRVGPLELDLIERIAHRNDRTIDLLPREFQLLQYFMRRPDQVVTRAMLLEQVWHYRFVPQTNVVDVHIGKLRRKIDGPDEAPMFESIPGQGFSLTLGD